MLSRSGQSEAPFELLVAVIIMGFVLFLGFIAINEVNRQQCEAEIKNNVSNLRIALEDVVRGNTRSVNFYVPTRFQKAKDTAGNEITEMILEKKYDRITCESHCGGYKEVCILFVYRSQEFTYRHCFNGVPSTIGFSTDPSECEEKDGYETVDFLTEEIPRGAYVLERKSLGSETAVVKVCAYHKIGSGS